MSYTSSPNGLFSYTISGTSDATEISVIQSAFDKWDSLLTVPDRFLDTGETKYTITVTYSVADLDTGILGSAALQTYRYVTSNTYGNMMPLTGFIQLNTDYTAAMLADVRTSGKTRYYYVVLHEIGHILGIGQFWSTSFSAPLSTYTEDSTTKYYYTGTNAVEQYKSYLTNPEKNLVLGIPVEDEGGTGTKNVHPEEGLEAGVSTDDRYINGVFHPGLNTELMTGWMDGTPDDTPLSRITLGFLADQGYNVNYNDAESFSIIYTNMSYNFDTLRNSGQTDEQIQAAYPNALLDASLGYFNNANKFKESYVKDLLDVSGNMKVYPGYKTLVKSSVEDGSHNIAGTLHTNTLNVKPRNVVTSDLSYSNTYTAIDSVTKPSYDYDFRQTVTASSNTTDMTDYISNSPVSYSGSVSFSSSTGATVSTNAYLAFSPTISGPAFSIEYYYTSNGSSSGATNWRFILGLYDNTSNYNSFHWTQRGYGDPKNQFTMASNTGSNTYDVIDRQEYNSTMHQGNGSTYHDVIVMDGTNMTTYRNGNQIYNFSFSYTESQFPTGTMTYSTIGNKHSSVTLSSNATAGASPNQTHLTTVHAYRLWNNHALTSTEVATLYANRTQSNLFQQTSYLVYTTLPDLVDLSLNRLSVNEDVSFNKHVTIGGNLTVKGAFKLPDNSLEPTDFSDYDANSTSVGPNEFNFNNSNIFSSLDLSGIDVYVAGETTVNANDFKIEGNVYANSIINDEKDNPIIEDNTLINRLDLSNNPFKVKKSYAAANYAGILDKDHSSVPYISDTGKNMSFMNFNSDGTYNTVFSNNYGASLVDMAVRLGGTSGTSNTDGLLNLHVTDNQKYIYGINPSRGIVKSSNYGNEFTDVSMVSLLDSDLSFSILGASVFDLSHADTICSSSDGKHTYIGGIIPNSLNQVDYKLIKSSDYGNNFVFDISTNQIGIIKQVDLSLNEASVRHLSCSSDGKYVVANIKGVTKANYIMNDLTGTSHPVLSTDYGNNWQLLNSHHFNEYQVLENLDLSFNQNKLKMDCVGLKISKTGRYIACALGSQELTNKMLFYLSSDYGKSFDFKSILNNDNTTFEKQINLSPNAEHIATFSTHQGSKVNISTDYGENWKEVDLTLNGLTANNSAKSYVSGNLQYLAHNSKEPITASLGGVNITHDFDFRVASTTGITEPISGGAMTYSNGAYSTVSNGLILDGTNDYAEGDGFDVNFSGAASFEFYIKFNNTTASETIFSLTDSTFSDGFTLTYVYNSYVETGQYSGGTSIYRPSLTNAQALNSSDYDPRYNHANNWVNGGSLTHCVIVYNSTTGWSLYKNGSLHSSHTTFQSTYYSSVTPTAPNATNVNRKLTVGTTNTNKSAYASMELAYFRVYDSELSSTQISTLYSNRNTASTVISDINIRSHEINNTFITPYVKTCYTHMVKDNANILNGNASANTDITYSGGVLTASDYRLKSNIQTLSGETLDNLRPVKFNFTHNNHKTFGLIAHELQEEYPYLVDGEKDGANYQTVNYTGLLGLCAHELQQIKKGLEEYD